MGKQYSLNGTHARLQYVCKLRQRTVAFVPSNSLILWPRCWCCCLSAPLAEAALISAYLNCELITGSQFSLSSVHYCLNPHEDPSIFGTAGAQQHVLHLTTYRSTYLYIRLYAYYRSGGGQNNRHTIQYQKYNTVLFRI